MKNFIVLLAMIFSITLWAPSGFAQDAEDLIIGLRNAVEILNLNNYVEHFLVVKLDSARQSVDSGRYREALLKMQAFKLEVKVIASLSKISGKSFLSESQATILLNEADEIISSIKTTTAAKVGVSGGTVAVTGSTNPINGASVTIPEEAVTSETLITIAPDPVPPPFPSNVTQSGPAIAFGPEGLTFSTPVLISVPYSSETREIDEPYLTIFTYNDSSDSWEEVPVVNRDIDRNILYAEVSHFSSFQAGKKKDDPNAPTINTVRAWSTTTSTGKGMTLIASITDPNGGYSFLPDNIASVRVTDPNENLYYEFIKGDYYHNLNANNEFYLKWKPLSADPPSGEYTFTVTDIEGKTSSMTKNLVVSALPAVDPATVQIYDYALSNWRSADNYEGVQLDKGLRVRWNSAVGFWYRLAIMNWPGTIIYISPRILNPLEIIIPYDVLNTLLINNAIYGMRVEVLDNEDLYVNSNRSLTKTFLFTTGSSTFSETNIYSAYCQVRNYETYGLRRAVYVTMRGANDLSSIEFKSPQSSNFQPISERPGVAFGSYTLEGGVVEYYYGFEEQISDISEIEKGGYIFRAINGQGNMVYLKDYLNMPRVMPFPVSISPGLSSPTPPPEPPSVNTLTPQYQWQFLSDARVYGVYLEEINEDNTPVQLFIKNGITTTNFTFSFNLKNGGKYRWQVRAFDGESNATTDNRSIPLWRYFRVQVP